VWCSSVAASLAFEFGHVFQRAGAQVTILEVMDRALPMKEREIVEALLIESRRIGMEVITGAVTSKIVFENGGYTVHFAADGKEHTRSVAMVTNGAGQVANLADLDLAAAGIDMAGPVLSVDKYLRSTSNPSVLGAGDTMAGPQLSALATYEGRIAGQNAMAGDGAMTEAKYASVPYAETAAIAKVLVENGSDEFLGAHILGHGAAESIHTFSFAIKYGIRARELANNAYAYPTMTNDIRYLV